MQEELFLILKNSLSITFFVLAMMLFIEFINVKTSGTFTKKIQRKGWQQIAIGVVFGILPGCLGTYTVVTLFSHNLVSLGALFATFVATMGDEAFLLFSLDVKTFVIVTAILTCIAIVGGVIVDFVHKPKNLEQHIEHFEIHEHEIEDENDAKSSIWNNIKAASPHRATLLFGVLLIFVLSVFGEIGHSHDIMPLDVEHHDHVDWFSMTFMLISLITAYILVVVPEHFLEHHFWNHIIKKHFFKILGWTTCIIAIIHVIDHYVVIQDFVSQYQWQILLLAVMVGLIPESGPHIVFISLFLSGNIPLSILLANSLTQDGHGGLPLFAENKKTFFFIKIVKALIALIVGFVGLQLGF